MEQTCLLIKTNCQILSTFFLICLEKLINICRLSKSDALQYELHEIVTVLKYTALDEVGKVWLCSMYSYL